ncbi:MAG: hypothetical protein LBT25_11820 [Candidatus Symbiothrix sp.]|nr:hypothetical protein [Candidatus Symbiothrix sp.]
MKKLFLITGLIVLFSGFYFPVKGEDTLKLAKKEPMHIEAISYDTLTYTKFKENKFYRYEESLIKKISLGEYLYERINYWLAKYLHRTLQQKEFNYLLLFIGILFVLVLLVFIFIKKPALFFANKRNLMNYTVDYEGIEIQNPDMLIEQAIGREQYTEAICLQYLKTLKMLHEKELISYDSYKTVNEYVYEIKTPELRSLFKSLSLEFIYFRYGKGIAASDKFTRFRMASEDIIKISMA